MPRCLRISALVFSSLLAFIPLTRAVTNNLALTPPMGWNDWNSYGCKINENAVTNNAAIIIAKGLKAAGYQYVDIDDGWASSRDSNGIVQAYTNFPDGIPFVANYVHSLGLKLGVYTDDGTNTCSTCINKNLNPIGKDPGSFNYEYVDAFTYATYGADYLKDDNCNANGEDGQLVYGRMSDGLMKSGRPILFCLCGGEAGNAKSYQSWSPNVGNYWRTTGDIGSTFASMISHIDPDSTSAFAAGPGRWNDPDMLEIGNGEFASNLTAAQTHFTMWCIMAAPLVMGNNLTGMSAGTLQILTNAEAIAVDQDPAGEQGIKVFDGGSSEVFSKPLGYDFTTRAVALLNRDTNNSATITCYWTNLDLQSGTATVRDLWTHTDLGTYSDHFTATIPPYGSMLLKIVGTPNPIPSSGTNYLSDLQPVYAYTGFGTIVKDKSIGGRTITNGGVVYLKGIGVNSRSGVEYNLGGVCTRFQAKIGIDDEVSSSGSVIFEVFADGVQIYNSGAMTGSTATKAIDLDVTGVRRLTLGVDDDDNGTSNDHADWANALVIAANVTQVPHAPTGLTANPGNAITLNWNNTLAGLTYNVKRSTTSGSGYTIITNIPITTFADSNIVNGQTYYYVVSAVSSLGESSNSVEVAAAQCFVPNAPTNVVKSSTAISNIVVKWNQSPGATSYNVYRFTANTPPTKIASGISTTNFTDSPVNAATTNYYYVTAVGSCSESGWANFAGAVTPPAAPTGLTATPGNSQITLSWNVPPGGVSFNVKRATVSNGPYTTIAGNISSAGYLDLTAANGTTYFYVVSAIDVGGEGPNSLQVSATAFTPATAYWTNTITSSAQNWNANANWTNTPAFPNSSGVLTIINANISASQTINLNQAVTVGSMQVGDANGSAGYTIAANGGSLTFGDVNTVSLTQVSTSKGDVFATPISIATNLVVVNNSANPLTFAGDVSSSGGAALTIGSGALQVGDGATNGSLGSVNVTDNASLIFNRSNNVTMSGTISGSGFVAQNGTGVLSLSSANSFAGGLTIQNGTLQAGNKLALGAQGGTVVITNGGTLDVNGLNVTNVALTVSGWGVNSNGAIISGSSASQLHAIQSVTMTGDAAFGGPGNWLTTGNPGRWDIRNSGTTLTMSGGKPFNLYKVGSNQMSFVSVTIDTNLANIDIRQGMMGFEAGSTSMGNPASNLIVRAGATLEFYQSSAASNSYTKQFILYGDGVTPCITNWPGGGISSIYGQMTLNGNCVIGVNGTSFTNNCAIAGSGNLIKTGPQPLTLGGVSTYTGSTTVNSGGAMILRNNGSISGGANIIVNSGATLDASARNDGTLTLANGQTLAGSGIVKGNVIVTTGATLAPANSFAVLTFNNNLTLTNASTTIMELNKSLATNDVVQVAGTLNYGGTLVLTNLSGTLAAGDSFKLFNAGIYSGAFTNISPAIPGINLAWSTNNLSSGILSVVATPTTPPKITAMNLNGSNFIFDGSNGPPNWPYSVLTATNVALPLTNWTILLSNTFDASGHFSFTNPAGAAAGQFYLLKLQ